MPEPLFPIFGPKVPAMLGRSEVMQRIVGDLTKQTPSHLSIVGPRHSGKSVILNAVCSHLQAAESPYDAVILWDLGNQTPASDSAFISILRDKLAEAITRDHSDGATELRRIADGDFSGLKECLEVLDVDGIRVLVLWDGFDRALGSGLLTRNLWDQLRELASLQILRFVTATRRPMIELLRSEDSATSDFWNIFDMTPVRVGVFDDSDCASIFSAVPNLTFEDGARTELQNWTAGYPPLFLCLFNEMVSTHDSGSINNDDVNQAAERIIEDVQGIVDGLWRDCPAASQDLYRHLIAKSNVPVSEVNRRDVAWLLERGFAVSRSNRISVSCRFLSKILEANENGGTSIANLFGDWDNYQSNIRGVLERRLGHLTQADQSLVRLIRRGITDIPEHPNDCLHNISHIQDRALDVIFQNEFGDDRVLPQGVWDQLHYMKSDNNTVSRLQGFVERPLPGDRLLQLQLLQALTGSHHDFTSQAKFATKDMYVLVAAIHSFRNRTQHADGEEMDIGVAVAAIMICLELLGCIENARRGPQQPNENDPD